MIINENTDVKLTFYSKKKKSFCMLNYCMYSLINKNRIKNIKTHKTWTSFDGSL